MKEIAIQTADGVTDGYAFYPENKSSLAPVIFYMDVFGVRDSLFAMAQRMADWGYYVLVPNLYYRKGKKISFLPSVTAKSELRRNEMLQTMQSLTMQEVMADTKYYLDFVFKQENTGKKAACTGYCMGGPFSLSAAGTFPDQIVAAASFHGARLATDKPDSPHLLASKMKAKIYVGIAEIDPHFTDEEKLRLENSLKENNIDYRMEVYPGVKHGFSVPDSHAYDRVASEHHFDTLKGFLKDAFLEVSF
ncbi:dienelactone hydrolase family protein [Arachidicoccus sp.]|jgi:carboxymethylenebutenolidase|uniref:dienelactone hydrolase family protein n=1 Tax=Arachidicoccus sp. TaxID=1872624 RepID=UPI003D1B851C